MTRSWLAELVIAAAGGSIVRAVIIATAGSTPREAGAHMLVTRGRTIGTIGGGALEHDVIARARALLEHAPDTPWPRAEHTYHLGPELAQCCGGTVRLLLERFGPSELAAVDHLAGTEPSHVERPLRSGPAIHAAITTARANDDGWLAERVALAATPLIVYGAGHVGRALVCAVAALPFAITWVDIARDRFPARDNCAANEPAANQAALVQIVAHDPALVAASAPAHAVHLVMTHSHALDETIVAAILGRGQFAYLGLIGSATKGARFRQRLARMGLEPAAIARLTCPIGLPGLRGKAPAIIAVSVAADLLLRCQVSDGG